jgi:hypothetical protein
MHVRTVNKVLRTRAFHYNAHKLFIAKSARSYVMIFVQIYKVFMMEIYPCKCFALHSPPRSLAMFPINRALSRLIKCFPNVALTSFLASSLAPGRLPACFRQKTPSNRDPCREYERHEGNLSSSIYSADESCTVRIARALLYAFIVPHATIPALLHE